MRNFFIWGSLIIAPLLHLSYCKIFPKLIPELTKKGALKKVVLDQLFIAPLLMVLFYPTMNILDGKTLKDSFEELK